MDLKPPVVRGASETPADLFLAAVEPVKPRDVEIHEPRSSLFHARRMGQRHLEQILRALGRPLMGEQTGDASQSCHWTSQGFSLPWAGRARERRARTSDVKPASRVG